VVEENVPENQRCFMKKRRAEKKLPKKVKTGLHVNYKFIHLHPNLSDGVTGNTSDFGSEESRFEP
jgi:hypothetical protein